ncbi:tetratricopeptide repeat protein, partial [Campylobacter jejuni]|nr:tetratricopeptide repeat protein [Campylobacter jejuni]
YSTKIYGSYSAVTRLASAISGHGSHINIHDLLNERQKYNILKKYYHCLDIHRDQKAYSSFYTYLSGLKTGIKLKKLQNYLEDALKLDLDNDKYRIYLVDCLMKQGKIQEAENYLKNIIKER